MSPEPFGLALSAGALIVACWSVVVSRRTGAKQARIQERLLSLESSRERDRRDESRRASLRGSIEEYGRLAGKLRIVNQGASEARAIVVRIDGERLSESQFARQGLIEVTALGAGASTDYVLIRAILMDRVIALDLDWEDDSGIPGRWRTELLLAGA